MDKIFGNSSTIHRTATWKPEPNRRGTFGILSTCLVTLSLCVWTAIHLNIPSSEERFTEEPRDQTGGLEESSSEKRWWKKFLKNWCKIRSWERFRWTAQTLRKVGWMWLGLLAPELVRSLLTIGGAIYSMRVADYRTLRCFSLLFSKSWLQWQSGIFRLPQVPVVLMKILK